MDNQCKVIILRRDSMEAEVLAHALQCAFPHQLQVETAYTLEQVVDLLAQDRADLVVMDFRVPLSSKASMTLSDGLQVIRYLSRRRHRPVQTIVVGAQDDYRFARACLQAGAGAFVMDEEAVTGTVRALLSTPGFESLYLEENEVVLSNDVGEPLFALNCEQAESVARLSAFVQQKLRRISDSLDTGGFDHLIAYGPGFEAMFETRGDLTVFATEGRNSSRIEPGLPPAGHSLRERFEMLVRMAPGQYTRI